MSKPEDHNVIVSGYPKSGNTWTTRLVAEAIGGPVKGFWGTDHPERASEGQDRQSQFAVYKAHHRYEVLITKGKIDSLIYVVRDPRDVACSAAHYFGAKKYNALHGTKVSAHEAMVRSMVGGGPDAFLKRPWSVHVEDYLCRGVHYVKYEDLLENTLEVLTGILDKIGVKASRSHLEQTIERQSFDAVKKKFAKRNDKQNVWFLRKGKAGSFKDELTKDQIDRLEKAFSHPMSRFGYTVSQPAENAPHPQKAMSGFRLWPSSRKE